MENISKTKHETKICGRCRKSFECKVGSIILCQCSTVKLTDAERDYLNQSYSDCLCALCMKEMRSEYHIERFKAKLKKLLRIS